MRKRPLRRWVGFVSTFPLALFITSFFIIKAAADCNLTPYQPPGWSDKIVVARSPGQTIDSPVLTPANDLYVSFAVINTGPDPAVSMFPFWTDLYVDDNYLNSFAGTNTVLPANAWESSIGYPIGKLSAGTHMVLIFADSLFDIPESDEGDNVYIKTITVQSLPDLAPVNIAVTPNPALPGGTVSVGYTVTNQGNLPSSPCHTTVTIKDVAQNIVTQQTFVTAGLASGAATNENHNFALTGVDFGAYNIYISVDSSNEAGQGPATNNDSVSVPLAVSAGLVIIPTFDSSITGDPQAATIEATINSAISVYQSRFSDPVTVRIIYTEMTNGLGENSSFIGTIPYSSYYSALASHATTVDDASALAPLPAGASNPVNGNANIVAKLPVLRALGFGANPPSGSPDGIVGLNISICNLTTNSPDPGKYSLFATACHEMDEVLGLGSFLDIIKNSTNTFSGPVECEDLFRYDGSGARSYTTNTSGMGAASYFSLDGTTHLAQFNQEPDGDFGDWYSKFGMVTPQVQDAFATPGSFPVMGVELRALDVVGFTLVPLKTNQTIAFGPLPNIALGEPPFGVSATASSGLPVSFSILSGPATISSGTNVTATGLGPVTVRASQSGNANYNPAPNVDQSFTVFAPPTVSTLLSSTNIVLTWPTNVAGFTLLTTTNLADPNSWTIALPAPLIANGLNTFTNGATETDRFYQLKK